jgi:hypothetical protein
MIDKLSQALALVREAFADAQAGAVNMASVDLAAEVDGAQRVINAASAVQAVRVAQYAGREQEQDGSGAWVEVDHGWVIWGSSRRTVLGRCWRWARWRPGARWRWPRRWPPGCR